MTSSGRTFNCGSGTEISIGDLVCLIGEVMGREVDRGCGSTTHPPGGIGSHAPRL